MHLSTLTYSVAAAVLAFVQVDAAASNPCAQISQIYDDEYGKNNNTDDPELDAQLAYDCLNSMPFNSTLATQFVDEVKKYLQWESNADLLKNPPSGYLNPAVDLFGTLAEIRANASANKYASQYAFDTAIERLWGSANEGHLSISTCSYTVFSFQQRYPLVSVSEDGVKLPNVYLFEDVQPGRKKKASPITSVNGQNVANYVESLVALKGLQDPDARYNTAFLSLSRSNQGIARGAFASSLGQYPGANVTLAFKNGTVTTLPNLAIYAGTEFNFTDGHDLWEAVCWPGTPSPIPEEDDPEAPEMTVPGILDPPEPALPILDPLPAMKYYPKPVLRDDYNLVSGYYLSKKTSSRDLDTSKIAVLKVPTFSTSSDSSPVAGYALPDNQPEVFSDTAAQFVQQALKQKKTKIVIDLSGNPGGVLVSGFDLFKIFFPQKEIYTATRFRTHDAINMVGTVLSAVNKSSPIYENTLQAKIAVTPNQGGSFSSWSELYGPHQVEGVNLSTISATVNLTLTSDTVIPIRGYGVAAKKLSHSQPFAADNILIMTDGYCASTCAAFVELMKREGGVKSIVFGGRPQSTPMQAVGGTKGGQALTWSAIQTFVEAAKEVLHNDSSILTKSQHELLSESIPIPADEFPLLLGTDGNTNFREAYTKDNDDLSLQFTYEAADCRLFYTVDSLEAPEQSWVQAAKAYWGKGKCVQGSTNGEGSLSAKNQSGFHSSGTQAGNNVTVIPGDDAASGETGSSQKASKSAAAGQLTDVLSMTWWLVVGCVVMMGL